ncbi:MAG: hypothetical protein ABJP45_01655 [Cyclobacteriaceae bacterium]
MEESNLPKQEIVRVYNQEKNIILYQEPYSTTKEQLDINFQKISKLSKDFGDFYLLIDLTAASRPNAEIRQHIFEKFAIIKSSVQHVAIFTEKNLLLNMAATFIMKKTGLQSFSIHKKLKEAEQAIEKNRR